MKNLYTSKISGLIVFTLMISCIFAVSVGAEDFTQSFNTDTTNVDPATFEYVERPVDGTIPTSYTAYTPTSGSTGDGCLKSTMVNGSKAKITFGQNYTNSFIFEGQFRYEGKEAASSAIKFFDIYNSSNKDVLMFTIGTSYDDGFEIRPVHKKADGTLITNSFKVNGGKLAYGKWHTLKVVFDTKIGSFDVYVDGYVVATNCFPYLATTLDNISYVQSYHSASGHTKPFLIDNVNVQALSLSDEAGVSSTSYSVGVSAINNVDSDTPAADFLSRLVPVGESTMVLYSDYASKTVRTGMVSNGDILAVTSESGDNVKLYMVTLKFSGIAEDEGNFLIDFNDMNMPGLNPAGFGFINRPADSTIAYTPYFPDGSNDGCLMSDMINNDIAQIDFGRHSGYTIFEGDFRYDSREAASASLKLFDIYDSDGKSVLMFTIGVSDSSGYNIRPVHKSSDGTAMSNPYDVNGKKLSYAKWHHLQAIFDTAVGTFKVYVNGSLVCENCYPWGGGDLSNISRVKFYHNAEGHTVPFLIDNISVYNVASESALSVSTGNGLNSIYTDARGKAWNSRIGYSSYSCPSGWVVSGSGVKLCEISSSVVIDLPSVMFEGGSTTFAIRTYGAGFKAGAQYSMQPYVIYTRVTDGYEVTKYGTIETFIAEENGND